MGRAVMVDIQSVGNEIVGNGLDDPLVHPDGRPCEVALHPAIACGCRMEVDAESAPSLAVAGAGGAFLGAT